MNADPAQHPTDQTLHAFSLGKLADASVEVVNAHLEQCAVCRKRVAGMSSDSFLDRVRVAQNPAGANRSAPGTSRPVPSSADPGHTSTLPPDLADHPDYQIVRELGRGGMGVVYLAHNRLMGRDEVLKVVSKHMLDRKNVLERFLREIRAAAQRHHANVVNAYSAFRSGESIVFAMEYVDGVDLAKMVKTKGPLPVAHACYFTYQVALGLQHAHEQGLVHRDIKPANLMLARSGKKATVKVLDFGLAKATREQSADSALTREGQMLGTPECIAPEQIRDAQSADIRADIYSLGCTLYYLLTGGPPFRAENLWDLYQSHFSMEADPLNLVRPEVPAELAALVAKMMAKEPERRFQTPAEVAQALLPFFKDGSAKPAPTRTDVSTAGGAVMRENPVPIKQVTTPSPKPAAATAETRWESLIEFKETERPPIVPAMTAPASSRHKARPSAQVAIAALVLGIVALGAIVITIKAKDGTVVTIKTDDHDEVVIQHDVPSAASPKAIPKPDIERDPGNTPEELGQVPPSKIDEAPAANVRDLLKEGTVWKGLSTYLEPEGVYPDFVTELSITHREGDHFEGVYAADRGQHTCSVRGSIKNGKIIWEKTKGIVGDMRKVGDVNWDGSIVDDRIDIHGSYQAGNGSLHHVRGFFLLQNDRPKPLPKPVGAGTLLSPGTVWKGFASYDFPADYPKDMVIELIINERSQDTFKATYRGDRGRVVCEMNGVVNDGAFEMRVSERETGVVDFADRPITGVIVGDRIDCELTHTTFKGQPAHCKAMFILNAGTGGKSKPLEVEASRGDNRGAAIDDDRFQQGTYWKGIFSRLDGSDWGNVRTFEFRVTKRQGTEFEGIYSDMKKTFSIAFHGNRVGDTITWAMTDVVSGVLTRAHQVKFEGTIKDGRIDPTLGWTLPDGECRKYKGFFLCADKSGDIYPEKADDIHPVAMLPGAGRTPDPVPAGSVWCGIAAHSAPKESVGDFAIVIKIKTRVGNAFTGTYGFGDDQRKTNPMILDVNGTIEGESIEYTVTGPVEYGGTRLKGVVRGDRIDLDFNYVTNKGQAARGKAIYIRNAGTAMEPS